MSFNTITTIVLLSTTLFCGSDGKSVQLQMEEYNRRLEEMMKTETSMKIGATLKLSEEEEILNSFLMREKKVLAENTRLGRSLFPPAHHFFNMKKLIEESKLFQVIKQLPKGGNLHLHSSSLVDPWWIVNNATYRPDCYFCGDITDIQYFHFFKSDKEVTNQKCVTGWKNVRQHRQDSSDVSLFDRNIFQSVTLFVDNPQETYPTKNAVWIKFDKIIGVMTSIIRFKDVFVQYTLRYLEEFHADNVQYLEIRHVVSELYDLDGTVFSDNAIVTLLKKTVDQFKNDHSGFYDAKFILSASRTMTLPVMEEQLSRYEKIVESFPDLMLGFDISRNEDMGNPTSFYARTLLETQQRMKPRSMKFFFHAGETRWHYTIGNNVFHAFLLNTSRIGHGLSIMRHPFLMDLIKQHNIPIEVNPISNQILMVEDDLRNHPAVELIARNFSLVIGSDNNQMFGTTGMSYDYYAAFVALAGEDGDLRVLKQLFINSLQFSALQDEEKAKVISMWTDEWELAIRRIIGQEIMGMKGQDADECDHHYCKSNNAVTP